MLTRLPRCNDHVVECVCPDCPRTLKCMTTGDYYWFMNGFQGNYCRRPEYTQQWRYITPQECSQCGEMFQDIYNWTNDEHVTNFLTNDCGLKPEDLFHIHLCPECVELLSTSVPSIEDLNPKLGGDVAKIILMSTEEYAKLKGMHPESVRRACRNGQMSCQKIGGRWRIAAEVKLVDGQWQLVGEADEA